MEQFDPKDAPGMTFPYGHVAVLGGGSWGTAIGAIARRAGRSVSLWCRNATLAREITVTACNSRHLDGVELPPGIAAHVSLPETLAGADVVFLAVPSHAIRDLCRQLRPLLSRPVPIVLCAKGIEAQSGLLLSGVVEQELPDHPVGTLSGPTFAAEAARGDYTAATIAFAFRPEDRLQPETSPAARLAVTMGSASFRPYISDDLIGVEVGGAMKNVIAIACGIMAGKGFAENTRAALIARGMDEMKVLATALGGRRATVTGLAGAGDLTLTCSSRTSRNLSLGLQLGQGTPRAACFEGREVVVEGERNAVSIHALSRRLGLSLPICETVHDVLHGGRDIDAAFAALWARPIESEPFEMDLQIPHPVSALGAVA